MLRFYRCSQCSPQRLVPNPPILCTLDLIRETRAYKDSLLRHGDDSPLLPDDRLAFGGLAYYPIDLRYRIVGQMHLYARQRQIEVPTPAARPSQWNVLAASTSPGRKNAG